VRTCAISALNLPLRVSALFFLTECSNSFQLETSLCFWCTPCTLSMHSFTELPSSSVQTLVCLHIPLKTERTPCACSMHSLQSLLLRVFNNSGVHSLTTSLLSFRMFWCAHLARSSLNSKQSSSALLALASQSFSTTLVCTPCTSLRAQNTQKTTDIEIYLIPAKENIHASMEFIKHTVNIQNIQKHYKTHRNLICREICSLY
jgi:hypothetical protein